MTFSTFHVILTMSGLCLCQLLSLPIFQVQIALGLMQENLMVVTICLHIKTTYHILFLIV